MNLSEAKDRFYELVSQFFTSAEIRWANTVGAKAKPPYIMLRAGDVSRNTFPRWDDEGNILYDCSVIMEVNLYSRGQPVTAENYENTATSDLTDFVLFLESEASTDQIAAWGMSILITGPVRDLTELNNDTRFRYRAMAEFQVSFAQAANGWYGLGNMPYAPNSSGGGTQEMVEAEIESIDDVEIDSQTP